MLRHRRCRVVGNVEAVEDRAKFPAEFVRKSFPDDFLPKALPPLHRLLLRRLDNCPMLRTCTSLCYLSRYSAFSGTLQFLRKCLRLPDKFSTRTFFVLEILNEVIVNDKVFFLNSTKRDIKLLK